MCLNTWAKQNLLSARLDYAFQAHSIELQNIRSLLTPSLSTPLVESVLPPEPQEESTPLLPRAYSPTVLEVAQRAKKSPRCRRKLLSLQIPNWFSGTIWEAKLTKISTSGWTFSLNSYAIVDWRSPVFQATFEGRLADLQYLFSSGQASPFLRDENGATLLHVSRMSLMVLLPVDCVSVLLKVVTSTYQSFCYRKARILKRARKMGKFCFHLIESTADSIERRPPLALLHPCSYTE
jgi:hypothetical protein